ncbi:MAG: domain S-box protein [Gemmatimonadetes bacterium]|nr:domain S-box protein [Gemmatimonadota bacterium]
MTHPLGPTDAQGLLRMVTEKARIGLAIHSADRQYIYANSTYAELLGLPLIALTGQRIQDVLPDVYETQVRPRLDRAFAGERIAYRLQTTTAAGERHYAVSYEPMDVDGTIASVAVVITDITEYRQTQEDSSRFGAIVESSVDAIISKDLNGVVTSWNAGAERMFGYSATEMIGAPINRLIPDDRLDEEAHILARIRRCERVPHFETVRRTRSGRLITVSIAISPIKDADGIVVGASKVARDVSEQKRADAALRTERDSAQRYLDIAGVILLALDMQGRVTLVNAYACSTFGWSADELIGRDFIDTCVPARLRPETRDRHRTVQRGDDSIVASEIVTSSGEERLIEWRTTFIRDDAGEITGTLSSGADITDRMRAEQALRAERDRAQRYLDTADVIMLALDTDGRITSINRKGCELLGWSEAELLGRDWVEMCLPFRTRPVTGQKFRNLLGGDQSTINNAVVTKDGYERLIEWRNRVLRDDAGHVVGTFSSGTDITERHEAVEALRAAEERMRFALRNADVGIWDMDYTTGVVRVSEILESQFGLKTGKFGGTFDAYLEGVHPDDRPLVMDAVDQATHSGIDFSVQHRALWSNGTVRWLSTAGRIQLDANGAPVRGVGISLDVTSRRMLEAQYYQAQKMEAVGRLAGGVAHDFNNLLTVILAYCQLLMADLDPEGPHVADVREIHRAGESAAGLTRQLLAFSRKQVIEPRLLDLNDVVGNVRKILERLIGEDVQIMLELDAGLGCVKADVAQVEQIIVNLAVNARDAMPDGGTLTIATANVELEEHHGDIHISVTPGSYVVLSVTDTGTGIPPDVQTRLFEPFFTTKPLGKGTGLGLATVHGIVTQNGGGIGVYSEVGQGASFKVYLPRVEETSANAVSFRPAVKPRAEAETVLVVEDAEVLRALTRRILELQGYSVLLAADASEAQRLFEQHDSIDVILTDVVMPGGSGPDLMRRLALQRPGLKVIYMSGYTEDAITHHGVLDPGIAFLHKPFTSETLGRKLREVLDR